MCIIVIHCAVNSTATCIYLLCTLLLVVSARKFMEALKNEGMVDEESLLESHLSSAYSKLQEQVAGNVAKQNLIMPRVEVRGEGRGAGSGGGRGGKMVEKGEWGRQGNRML